MSLLREIINPENGWLLFRRVGKKVPKWLRWLPFVRVMDERVEERKQKLKYEVERVWPDDTENRS